jgi:SRSO17 transposase
LGKRYRITDESKLDGCLVSPSNYSEILFRLKKFIEPFIEHLHKRVQRSKAFDYIKGLLSDVGHKNIESISYFHGYDRQRLQSFIGQVEWDDEIILDKLAQRISLVIGEQNGILILDPTTFPKKGNESVGVQRQWCGRLGKVENCQAATFLAYASSREFTLIDRRLYLPQSWIYGSYYEFRRYKCVKADFPTGKSADLTENLSVNSLKILNVAAKQEFLIDLLLQKLVTSNH